MTRTQHAPPEGPALGAAPAPATARPDGPAAVIRTVRAADQAALGEFFAALSPQSRYLRFFGPVTPAPALLRRLAGDAEGVDAVVAVRGGRVIGHAMAADRAGHRVTDIGVVVADAWQGRGVGAALMRALLTGARTRGMTTLTMDVLPGNQRVLAMIGAHWPDARTERTADGITVRVRLPLPLERPAAAC